MFDYDYDKDDFVWNPKTETWEATDGKTWDSSNPRLLGLIFDDYIDYGDVKLVHGHRYVKGKIWPEHLGVYVRRDFFEMVNPSERDRVVMEVIPSGNGALFTATYVSKVAI